MFHYKIKMLEAFKDGNILEGRFLKVNEVLIVTENEKSRIENSGGIFETVDTMVPNPLKLVKEEAKEKEPKEPKDKDPKEPKDKDKDNPTPAPVPTPLPAQQADIPSRAGEVIAKAKRGRGRPKKNG